MYMFIWVIVGTFHLIVTGLGTAVFLKMIVHHFEYESRLEEIEKVFDLGWRSMLLTTILTWILLGMSMGGYSSLWAKASERF